MIARKYSAWAVEGNNLAMARFVLDVVLAYAGKDIVDSLERFPDFPEKAALMEGFLFVWL